MYHLDICHAAKRHPALAGRGDAAMLTSGPDGAVVASVDVGGVTLRAQGATVRHAEARLLVDLTAARFGASVAMRPTPDGQRWAELLAPEHPFRAHRREIRVVLAWGLGDTDDEALADLAARLAGGSMLTPCAVCSGPGKTYEAQAFAVADYWPVGARKICRAGWLCACCVGGARELAE